MGNLFNTHEFLCKTLIGENTELPFSEDMTHCWTTAHHQLETGEGEGRGAKEGGRMKLCSPCHTQERVREG